MNALQLLLVCLAGWLNRNQQLVIEYLQEEVKVLREQLGKKPRFTDDQRRRLAAKARKLGRDRLRRFASLVSPKTLLERHRRLIARKYDGSCRRFRGRPCTPGEIRELILITPNAIINRLGIRSSALNSRRFHLQARFTAESA